MSHVGPTPDCTALRWGVPLSFGSLVLLQTGLSATWLILPVTYACLKD